MKHTETCIKLLLRENVTEREVKLERRQRDSKTEREEDFKALYSNIYYFCTRFTKRDTASVSALLFSPLR